MHNASYTRLQMALSRDDTDMGPKPSRQVRPRGRCWVNCSLSLGALLAALALGEVAARLAGFEPSRPGISSYQFDATLGWRTYRGFTYSRPSARGTHALYYNLDGLPTDSAGLRTRADRGLPSVALIGDSFAEGYYLPFEQTLEHRLATLRHDRQILNFGVAGYSPDQYLLAARARLAEFEVREIVVLFFPFNDVPYVDRESYMHYAKPRFGESLNRPINVPLRRSRPLLAESLATYTVLATFYRTFVRPVAPNYRYDLQGMNRSVDLIARIRRENPGVGFLVYYIPAAAEFGHRAALRENLKEFDAACDRNGLRCATAVGAFSSLPAPSAAYDPVDGHFSATGARLVAEHVNRLLGSDFDTVLVANADGTQSHAERSSPAVESQ